jgi:hypothetical protein
MIIKADVDSKHHCFPARYWASSLVYSGLMPDGQNSKILYHAGVLLIKYDRTT